MPALNPADIKVIFGQPPEQAIDYLRRKGLQPSTDWHAVKAAAHARAFTVAQSAGFDVLHDIRTALIQNMQQGGTFRDFQQHLKPLLEKKGWWGKTEDGVQLGSPRRLKTIYRANLQSAFMAARHAAFLEATATHPYWMYIAVMDGDTRESHAAMHGRVFRYDDPIWQTVIPPNGINCRCRFIALSEDDLQTDGLTVESSEGRLREVTLKTGVDKQTGEVRFETVNAIEVRGLDGRMHLFHADAGFNASPLQGHLIDQMLYDKAKRALGDLGEETVLSAVQRVLLNPARLAGWGAFVQAARKRGKAQGQMMAFGVLPVDDLAFARAQGAEVQTGLVFLHDRHLAGVKGQRHLAAGNALSTDEFKNLPQWFAAPPAGSLLLWDSKERIFLYLMPTGDGSGDFYKLAVRFKRATYSKRDIDDAATVFRIKAADVSAMLSSPGQHRVR